MCRHCDIKELKKLLRKYLPKTRKGQTKLFCMHWLDNDYYVGWYKPIDETVWARRITYPASSPCGWIKAGGSKRFEV